MIFMFFFITYIRVIPNEVSHFEIKMEVTDSEFYEIWYTEGDI
jgi:hypothetical protein